MKPENLFGGQAVGGALAVLFTHGGAYEEWEIAVLAAGAGAAVTFAAETVRALLNLPKKGQNDGQL